MPEERSGDKFYLAPAVFRSKNRITVPDEIRDEVLRVEPGDSVLFYALGDHVYVDSLATVLPRLLRVQPPELGARLLGLPMVSPIDSVVAMLVAGGSLDEMRAVVRRRTGRSRPPSALGTMLMLYELEARAGSEWLREFVLLLFLLQLIPAPHQETFARALEGLFQGLSLRQVLTQGDVD